jgi:hypothetical protein
MKKLFGLAVVAVVAVVVVFVVVFAFVFVVRTLRHHDQPDEKLVFDRVWIDHLPQNDRDMVNVFAVLADPEIGIFQSASQWKQGLEIFKTASRDGGKIGVVYPQTRERETVTVHAEPCKKGDFDYCLEVKGASRGVQAYVSRKGWEIDAHADLAHLRLPRL